MKLLKYHEWVDTAQLTQQLCQMMGKVKLAAMPAQPEWNHSLLTLTASGFTTGLIPQGESAFTITLDVLNGAVEAACTTGLTAGFRVHGQTSVSECYAAFAAMLESIGHPTAIDPTPQECFTKIPFDRQTEPRRFDIPAARTWFESCTLVYNALLRFSSPYRGKKILPSMFWGTFDLTCILFSGEAQPWPGTGVIPTTAFDEKLVEFGFWPGDTATDEPSLFALSYPFPENPLPDEPVSPSAAFFSAEKKEYFLPLSVVLQEEDPVATICHFCEDAFREYTEAAGWKNLGWYTKPLPRPNTQA